MRSVLKNAVFTYLAFAVTSEMTNETYKIKQKGQVHFKSTTKLGNNVQSSSLLTVQ